MKKTLQAVLVSLFCSALLSNPQAQAQISKNTNPNAEPVFKVAEADEEQRAHQVTASDYCDFLNQVEKSDSLFFYDEQLSSDSRAGCIVRTGRPGHYQYVQHVENNAPADWNTTRGWNAIATDWEKNKKEVEAAQRKMILKTTELSGKPKERQARRDHEEGEADDFVEDGRSHLRREKADMDEPTKWANFWKSFQEDNQPLVNQFSKEINKLVLDMTGGKRLPN